MPESQTAGLMAKIRREGPMTPEARDQAQADAKVALQDAESDFIDEYSLSPEDRKEFGFKEDHGVAWIRDPDHPIWKRHEGDSRLRAIKRQYPGSEVATNREGEKLYAGEDSIAVRVPKVHLEARAQADQEATRAYVMSNPVLLAEAVAQGQMSMKDAADLLHQYQNSEALQARESEFDMEDRKRVMEIARINRARSEMMRAQRASRTFGMSYEDAARQYLREIRRDLTATLGREPSQKQVAEAYEQFKTDMEDRARTGAFDRRPRDWSAQVARQRSRSLGQQYAFANSQIGETTEQKVRRRQGGP